MKLCTPLFNERAMHMMAPMDDGRGAPHDGNSSSSSDEEDEEEEGDEEEEAQGAGDNKTRKETKNRPSCCPAPEDGPSCCPLSDDEDSHDEGEDIDDPSGLPGPVVPASYAPAIAALLAAAPGSGGISLKDLVAKVGTGAG